MARGMPPTRRFGMMLVNNDPGPRLIRSARSTHTCSIGQQCLERYIGARRWVDFPSHLQYFRGELNSTAEIAGEVGHGGQEQVSKAVSFQGAPAGETVVEQAR